ncbi:MAG: alpha/beta hydrolase, partial [Bacteroidales bacterium]|nr:alpha/beta hydrolase [Bacteroidales bacterium]
MAVTERFTLSSGYDRLKISVLAVWPEGKPEAILQVAHGMYGYKERFLPFMDYMAENGVLCVANDHRGHGASVLSDKDLGY